MGIEERFWAKVDKTDGCWNWTATHDACGYGMFRVNGSVSRAHRFSFEMAKQAIPPGMMVLHSCDNPRCVNPDHLRLGTQFDNMREMATKGRGRYPALSGECHGSSKITADIAIKIRALYSTGKFLQRDIGMRFGITQSLVSLVVSGKSWPIHR